MKYLKRFESLFGSDEPELMPANEWIKKIKSLGRDFFSKTEMETLVNLMEDSGREHTEEEEWYNLGLSDKVDYYRIGLTQPEGLYEHFQGSYLTFYLPTYDGSNPYPFEVDITKCKDEWFFVSFYQDDSDDSEGYEEYYECDGFDCLLDLLKKEAKLG